MAVAKDSFDNFDWQDEVQVAGKPAIKQFKEWDTFIGYLQSINDIPLDGKSNNPYWNPNYGSKIFNLINISEKTIDHKSDNWRATWKAVANPLDINVEYSFFTNYTKYKSWTVWPHPISFKLSELPLGAVLQIKFIWLTEPEAGGNPYRNVSIIWKKDNKWDYVIHPDYKAVDNFDWQEEVSIEDLPFR